MSGDTNYDVAVVQREQENGLQMSGPVGGANELAVGKSMAAQFAEIQGAIVLARQFPRSFDRCYQGVMSACRRKSFADKAMYSFPRGGATVTGPSVNLAREAGKLYENIRSGLDVLSDDGDSIVIEGWAWDIEKNVKSAHQDRFRKLIQRKKGSETQWVVPDERDLRELIFRRGAILVRNSLLSVLPRDLIEDAMNECKKTLSNQGASIAEFKAWALRWFGERGITADQLNAYVGTSDWTAEERAIITGVFNAVEDGQAKLSDYFKKAKNADDDPPTTTAAAKGNGKSKADKLADDLGAGEPDDEGESEPEEKAETATKGGDKKKSKDQERKDLIAEITGFEGSKDLGGKKIRDLRMEYAGALDLSKSELDGITRYWDYLSRLSDKA